MAALIISLVLAVILGFAAHRASVCTVRAVAEVMHARTGYMFASIAKSILWIVAVTVPVFWFFPATTEGLAGWSLGGWSLTGTALLGGLVFGLGAGINGACAYSTMARLVDGEGAMLVAVLGFAAGVLGFIGLLDMGAVDRPSPAPVLIAAYLDWAIVVAGLIVLWCLYEIVRLWRARPDSGRFRDRALARQYRLSSAALVIGLTGAAIFLLFGQAGYSSTFELIVEGALGTKPWPSMGRWLLLVAVLVGMFLSTLQRGGLRLDWRPRLSWLRNLAGGALMGLGVALAPGGNDVLILYGIPTLSPHALPVYAALVVGVTAGLLLMRHLFGIEMRVSCRNDVYVSG